MKYNIKEKDKTREIEKKKYFFFEIGYMAPCTSSLCTVTTLLQHSISESTPDASSSAPMSDPSPAPFSDELLPVSDASLPSAKGYMK